MLKTLKGKISSVYTGLVILIAVVGVLASISLFNLSRAIDGLMIANYKSINAASNMVEVLERQDNAVLLYMSVEPQEGKDMFADNNTEFLKWFAVESGNITEKGEGELVDGIRTDYNSYVKLFMDLQEIRLSQDSGKSVVFYNTKVMPEFTDIKNKLKELSQLNERAMFAGKDSATANAQRSLYVVLVFSMIAIIGGGIASRYSANRFLTPISKLTQTMKLVKAGDLNRQADVETKDEIGELAREFNNMTKRLQQYEQSTLGKLLAEKKKSLAIVNSISEPLVVLDNDYRIVLLNPSFEKTFNVAGEALANRHFLEGVRNGEIFDFISDAFKSGEATDQRIFKIQTDSGDSYFNAITAAVRENDALSGMIVVFQNVTQLKELEKIRTDFIATISHELKTPLTSIMMGADVLIEEGMGALNDEQKKFVVAIREDCDRLTRLVSDLLELTRIESGRAIYKFQTHSIDDIIETAIKPFYHLAEQNEVDLYFQCEDDLPPVNADFEKIVWVLNNLISNALKYTGAGDEISVSAAVSGKKVRVTVKDTGMGIPEEYIDKIFEKFIQVKDGDFEVRGTGLGLAVAREIIEAHDGDITCESKVDAGSSFTFTLNITGRDE